MGLKVQFVSHRESSRSRRPLTTGQITLISRVSAEAKATRATRPQTGARDCDAE